MTEINMGYLLRSSTSGCVVGCRVAEAETPVFGAMVRIPLEGQQPFQVYGLIYDISIGDDGLVRQIVTAGNVTPDVVQDNRVNRNVPLEVSVLFVGYSQQGQFYHLLPPRPPLSLDVIYSCEDEHICSFTGKGFGYFRHILRNTDIPVGELLAAHIRQADNAHCAEGDSHWRLEAAKELITLLRDDYPTLMSVLGALGDTGLEFEHMQGGR